MSQINTVEHLYTGHQWGREKVSAMERYPLCIGLEFFAQIVFSVHIHMLALHVTPISLTLNTCVLILIYLHQYLILLKWCIRL